ncbi:MAG: 30S ribosomal protein S4 [Christensenellaceae bacterium]
MAVYREAKCKLCRREGAKLFLKGDKCYMEKCPFNKRPVAPGQHGAGRKKVSEYGLQLREKQKTKRIYGVQEGQFRKYYEMADRMKGVTWRKHAFLLERRLDNADSGWASPSRTLARQLSIGASSVPRQNRHLLHRKGGDVVAVKENRKGNKYFTELKETKAGSTLPKWVEFNREKLEGKVLALPTREDVDSQIAEHMIVELYSK